MLTWTKVPLAVKPAYVSKGAIPPQSQNRVKKFVSQNPPSYNKQNVKLQNWVREKNTRLWQSVWEREKKKLLSYNLQNSRRTNSLSLMTLSKLSLVTMRTPSSTLTSARQAPMSTSAVTIVAKGFMFGVWRANGDGTELSAEQDKIQTDFKAEREKLRDGADPCIESARETEKKTIDKGQTWHYVSLCFVYKMNFIRCLFIKFNMQSQSRFQDVNKRLLLRLFVLIFVFDSLFILIGT